MENVERDTYDIPGIGEFKARRGTSTAELAGAAAFWHKKYQTSFREGFLTACVCLGLAGIAAGAAIHIWF